jgi:hypothetical protein
MTPAENFAPSFANGVDISGKFATSVDDTGGKIWKKISGCRLLKENLKAKIYIYVNSTTQRCLNKIIKNFQIEDFFHLPPVHIGVPLLCEMVLVKKLELEATEFNLKNNKTKKYRVWTIN